MSAAWDWINEYRSGASFLWLGGVDRVSLNDFPVLWCEDLSFTREELGHSPIRFWPAGPGFLDWHQQFDPCEVPTPTPVAPEPEINIIPYEGLIAPVPKTPPRTLRVLSEQVVIHIGYRLPKNKIHTLGLRTVQSKRKFRKGLARVARDLSTIYEDWSDDEFDPWEHRYRLES